MAKLKTPAGPPGHWFWGNLVELRSDVLGFLETVPQEYGDLASLRFAGYHALLLSHPKWVEQVLVSDSKKFEKPPRFRRIVRKAFGNGIFANEGANWSTQRRNVQMALDPIRKTEHAVAVVSTVERMCETWQNGSTAGLEMSMVELSLAIRMRTTFGSMDLPGFQTVHKAIETFMEYFADSIQNPLSSSLWIPTLRNLRIRSALKDWWHVIGEEIEKANQSSDANSFLGFLQQQRQAAGDSAMPMDALRDEIATWILTGTETGANTLCWNWYLLARHPDVRKKLLAEIDAVLGSRLPAHADLPNLKYTESVLLEAMRLYPQAYIIGRKAIEPFDMNGLSFPKGTTVVLNQWWMVRDALWFDEPLEFRPERWLEDQKSRPKFAYFPFGGGPRSCAGKNFAMLELPLVLATIAQRFDFRLATDLEATPRPSLTLRADPNLVAMFSRRKDG